MRLVLGLLCSLSIAAHGKEALCDLSSDQCMEVCSLFEWDAWADKAIAKEKIPFHDSVRIYTYLYQAQNDAACLSMETKGSFEGSLGPVSAKTLALFLSDVPKSKKSDPYSEKLADIVVAKLQKRIDEEKKNKAEFKVPSGDREENSYGLGIAKWKPWHIEKPSDYWPPELPEMGHVFWDCQCREIHQMQCPLTCEKIEAIRYWAGLSAPGTGDWRRLANDHIQCCNLSLCDALQVRAVLMTGLYDTAIVCFTAKYHYMIPRPKKIDKSIDYEISCPKHPSYPAGHSTESAAAATILSHFFPQESSTWHAWAGEAGLSRIWAGIHYPIDDIEGQRSGRCVAKAVLEN